MNESEHSRKFRACVEAAGAWTTSLVAGMMQKPGLPDFMVVHKKYFGFVEAKMSDRELTGLQQVTCDALVIRTAPVCVVRYIGKSLYICRWGDVAGATVMDLSVLQCKRENGHALLDALKQQWEKAGDV